MTTRRKFLKEAALSAAAISSAGGLAVLDAGRSPAIEYSHSRKSSAISSPEQSFPGWEFSFDEHSSSLVLKNGPVKIEGQLAFTADNRKWSMAGSRDRLQERYTMLDPQGNVQGYFVINRDGGRLQLFFYHRSSQAYRGIFSFTGRITFMQDGFPCRTVAGKEERVLALSCGNTDSFLNDSLFSPESDTALCLLAADFRIETLGPGSFSFRMSGKIEESSESALVLNLQKDYFRNSYIPYYHPIDRKRCPKAPTGWMSWNTYFDKATADDNLAEAKIGKKYLQPFGCEFWHIESWQGNSEKLPVRDFYNMNLEVSAKKFPKGMKKLADDIRKLGFRPGIWMAPFGTGSKEFYESHKDWFIHDRDGKPVPCWNGRYTVDPTVPEALAHLKHIHDVASHEWGYEYFKVDGMSGSGPSYGAHFYERPEIKEHLKDPSCPNPFELCIKAFREGMGEDRVYLACGGHSTAPDVLYTDAQRIGADVVHPDQPVVWKGVYDQGRCTLNRIFANNIVTYTDPDTLLVNDLLLEEARVAATIVALPGQLTFFADKLAGLPGERMKILQQTLPVADVRPVSLYPYFSMLPVWNLRVKNSMLGDYNIVALFNWMDEQQSIPFNTSELGLDPEPEYALFEFWTQKSLETMRGSFELEVPAHCVRLLAMHRIKTVPQWISSDCHVAQNAMEIKSWEWKTESRVLEGKISLVGTFLLTMHLRLPDGYIFKKAECPGAKFEATQDGKNRLTMAFRSDRTGDFDFSIKF
jgi:hypothetical protein